MVRVAESEAWCIGTWKASMSDVATATSIAQEGDRDWSFRWRGRALAVALGSLVTTAKASRPAFFAKASFILSPPPLGRGDHAHPQTSLPQSAHVLRHVYAHTNPPLLRLPRSCARQNSHDRGRGRVDAHARHVPSARHASLHYFANTPVAYSSSKRVPPIESGWRKVVAVPCASDWMKRVIRKTTGMKVPRMTARKPAKETSRPCARYVRKRGRG